MLELFRDEIPEIDTLTTLIRQVLLDPKYDLEEIRNAVRDPLLSH